MLMYRAHARLLARILPPHTGGFTWEIGFAGPEYRLAADRPNFDGGTYELSPRGKYSDFVGAWANEGGAPEADMRQFLGYSRQAVTWQVVEDSGGAVISTGWHSWENKFLWTRHGTWPPGQTPYKWADCQPWEADLGYPWCTPPVHEDWWTDNELYVDCESCAAQMVWGLAGFPVGVAFVVVKGGGGDEVFAASRFRAPMFWRPGGYVYARYSGRFAAPRCHRDFCIKVARLIALGEAMPWSNWRLVLLETPVAAIRSTTAYSEVRLALADSRPATNWTITPYAESPEVLPKANLALPDPWVNTTEQNVTVGAAAVIADRVGGTDLLFWEPVSATLAPADTLRLTGIEFSLAEWKDA